MQFKLNLKLTQYKTKWILRVFIGNKNWYYILRKNIIMFIQNLHYSCDIYPYFILGTVKSKDLPKCSTSCHKPTTKTLIKDIFIKKYCYITIHLSTEIL